MSSPSSAGHPPPPEWRAPFEAASALGPMTEWRQRIADELQRSAEARDLARTCGYRPPMTQILAPLTPREREIAWLVASGLSDINIASRLSLSEETIGAHLRHIYRKLEIHSRVDLAARLGALDHALEL